MLSFLGFGSVFNRGLQPTPAPAPAQTAEVGSDIEPHVAHADSANEASSRTLSPEDQDDLHSVTDTPARAPVSTTAQVPPTPYFAPPQTPVGGALSPVLNQAAADQLRQEAESCQGAPVPPTPFFAPPQTPFAGNSSPVRNEAAAQQLRLEMLDRVPETPAPLQSLSQPTPMTKYATPALPRPTPSVPSTQEQEQADATPDAFQTPSALPSKRQSAHQDAHLVIGDLEPEFHLTPIHEGDHQADSDASSPQEPDDGDVSSAEDMDTSSTSVESSESEKGKALAVVQNKGRKNTRRPNLRGQSKSYDDRRSRIKKPARPGMSRSVSGREELLNKARKRFWERKADGDRLL